MNIIHADTVPGAIRIFVPMRLPRISEYFFCQAGFHVLQ